MDLAAVLRDGLSRLSVDVSAGAQQRLLELLDLLARWNARYNLTAIRRKEEMIPLHLLDSLTVLPYLRGPNVLDLGTGAGFPGLPLAITSPNLQFTLLDSNAKKTRFVTQAVIQLRLKNVEVVCCRSEDFHPTRPYNTVVTRAFGSLSDMLEVTQRLYAPGGLLVAMKGTIPEAEIREIGWNAGRYRVVPVAVPLLEVARHLILFEPPTGDRQPGPV